MARPKSRFPSPARKQSPSPRTRGPTQRLEARNSCEFEREVTTSPSPPPRSARILSWWWDYVLIVTWLLVVFVVVGLPQLLGWWDLSSVWSDPVAADSAITLLTVVPYFLNLVLTETSPSHATWGKRRTSLTVAGTNGSGPGRSAIVLRNVIKVLPWQLGHMGTMRLATSDTPSGLALWLETGSLVLLALIVLPILLGRRGVHDLLAGTRVTPTTG